MMAAAVAVLSVATITLAAMLLLSANYAEDLLKRMDVTRACNVTLEDELHGSERRLAASRIDVAKLVIEGNRLRGMVAEKDDRIEFLENSMQEAANLIAINQVSAKALEGNLQDIVSTMDFNLATCAKKPNADGCDQIAEKQEAA